MSGFLLVHCPTCERRVTADLAVDVVHLSFHYDPRGLGLGWCRTGGAVLLRSAIRLAVAPAHTPREVAIPDVRPAPLRWWHRVHRGIARLLGGE